MKVVAQEGRSVLALRSHNQSYFLGKEDLHIAMSPTLILTWTWENLPVLTGADSNKVVSDDNSVNLLVIFPPEKEVY